MTTIFISALVPIMTMWFTPAPAANEYQPAINPMIVQTNTLKVDANVIYSYPLQLNEGLERL